MKLRLLKYLVAKRLSELIVREKLAFEVCKAGNTAASVWKLRKAGVWHDTVFAAAMDELERASDAYLNLNLKK